MRKGKYVTYINGIFNVCCSSSYRILLGTEKVSVGLAIGIQLYILCIVRYEVSGVFVVYNSCDLWNSKNDIWSRLKVCRSERKDKNLQEKYYVVSVDLGFWHAGSVEIYELYNFEYQHIVSCGY